MPRSGQLLPPIPSCGSVSGSEAGNEPSPTGFTKNWVGRGDDQNFSSEVMNYQTQVNVDLQCFGARRLSYDDAEETSSSRTSSDFDSDSEESVSEL